MKTVCIVLLCLAVAYAHAGHDDHDHGDEISPDSHFPHVHDLTSSNFEETISGSDYTLVEFYAPWCGHCKTLAPEYAEAAKTLAENHPNIKLCKVDATKENSIAEKYSIEGFPTLKFFVKGESTPTDYNGGRTAPEIVNWLKRRAGSVSEEVKSVEDLERAISEYDTVCVFVGASSSEAHQSFVKTASSFEDVYFYHTDSAVVKSKYGVNDNSLLLFIEKGAEKKVLSELSDIESVTSFIQTNRYPPVQSFTQSAAQRIFGEGNDAIALVKTHNEAGKAAEEVFRSAAQTNLGSLVFTIANFEDEWGGRLAEFVGTEEKDLPAVWILQPTDNMKKFKLTDAVTLESMNTFISDFKNGRIQPYFKSEPVPAEPYDGNVRVIVGTNFKEVVFDEGKNVLVEFYAPWCGHCQSLAPIYEGIAAKVRHVDDLVIAKVDAAANEIDGVAIEGFPTIKLYTKDGKQSPVDFEGERTEQGILEFLARHTDVAGINTGRDSARPVSQDEAYNPEL